MRQSAHLSLLLLVMLSLGFSACGAESVSRELPVRSELVTELLEDVPTFQRVILEDGEVTPAEYEKAVLATMACVADAGYDVVPPRLDEQTGALYFFYESVVDDDGIDLADQEYEGCYDEYQERVDTLYFFNAARVVDQRDISLEDIAQCLRAAGIEDVPDVPSAEYISEVAASFGQPAIKCING